ncbi:hypothetical protein MRB53_030257 [Persea americana]|uniref:Uncharacterized protein n=1 Tax=Persea americana TaxID=3435 RepID=A0ACC2KKT5_PERAE|nr:hypothetical protein MRB53_030257 [Persea americana]
MGSSSSLEGSFIFSLLLSSLTIGYCHGDSCGPLSCSREGPLIRFPFRIKDLQPHHCGYPGFDLSCKGNDTTIHIPSLPQQELFVRRIDYKLQKLVISDPNDCLYGLLFNTTNNLSSSPSSPFHYYSGPDSYTLVRCSRNVDFGIWYTTPVPCLGDLEHDVFAVSTSRPVESLAVSCQPIKTVEIYRPYYGVRGKWQNTYMHRCGMDCETLLDLKWDVPGCDGECELNGGESRFKNQTNNEAMCFYHRDKGSWRKYAIIGGGVGFFLLLAAIMTSIKVYYSWKLKKKLDLENQMMVEKFLKDYDSLKPTRKKEMENKDGFSRFVNVV